MLNKRKYTTIIIAINFSLIAVLVIYLVLNNKFKTTITNPYVHYRQRDAFVEQHRGTDIAWSQNIGGSLNENAVAIFKSPIDTNIIHIFGNTQSNDFDFDFAGSFMAILQDNGRTVDFITINKGMDIVKVIIENDQYIILQNGQDDNYVVAVTRINFTGEIISTWSTTDTTNLYAKEIIFVNEDALNPNFIVIYSRFVGIFGYELIAVQINAALFPQNNPPISRIESHYSLDFLSAYRFQNQLVIFAHESRTNSAVQTAAIILQQVGGNAEFYRIDLNFEYSTLDLQPCEQGYIMVVVATDGTNIGATYIVRIDYDYTLSDLHNTKMKGVSFAKLLPHSKNYYVFLYSGQGGSMFLFDLAAPPSTKLQDIDGFSDFKNITDYFYQDYSNNKITIIGQSNRGVTINSIQEKTLTKQVVLGGSQSDREVNPIMLAEKTTNTITLAMTSYSASLTQQDKDVVRNFGDGDIWIVRLNQFLN
ncbi:MAG: hypothetical protein LBU60_05575 [Clostridiales bacterium]|jgi:hypothetical protein|nr:hypothetical protein [Clostridiales bacterium]